MSATARRALAIVAAAAAVAALQVSGFDRAVSSIAFDPATGTFPLREAWWLRVAGHTALKWSMVALWVAALIAGGDWRRGALYAAVIAIAVNVARELSPYSCPWDLAAFGGANPDTGRCLPAAHPLTGFAWFGLYFALRERRRRVALAVLGGACLVGAIAGAVQVARGAHFPSHVLWTAWLCWGLAALLAWRPRSEQDRSPDERRDH